MTRTSASIGVHALVWTGRWDERGARHAIASAKQAGYDLIELALLDPSSMDVSLTRRLLTEYELRATASLGLSPTTDVSSEDPDAVAAGRRLLREAVNVVRDVGGDTLCGVLYSRLGKYPHPATAAGRANAVETIQQLADHADQSGIRLALEVVNRYESNLINTAEQALSFISEVDRPNVYVHLDTYHMNIEERDMYTPVLACGPRLGYVHIGESHRGYLGSGTVDLTGFFHALAAIGYAGTITFESFSNTIVEPTLSTNLAVWRNLWDDSADLARHARRTIQAQLHASADTPTARSR